MVFFSFFRGARSPDSVGVGPSDLPPLAGNLMAVLAIQPEMAINPATVRDGKTLESANETREPTSVHPYDSPVPLTARSTLVELVCCQRLEVTWPTARMIDHLDRGGAVTS